MSILSSLFDRLRAHGKPAGAPAPASATSTAQAPSQAAPTQNAPAAPATAPAQASASQQPAAPQAAQPAQPAQATHAAALNDVDLEQVLEGLAARSPQKLNWRTSIVDLMKLLGMDSSLQERKALADELGYHGDKNDSAAMNIWLHQQVMHKVAENGGKVPADLLA